MANEKNSTRSVNVTVSVMAGILLENGDFNSTKFITNTNSKVRSSKYYGVCFGSVMKIHTGKRLALLLAIR